MSLSKYPSALDDASNMPDRVPFVDLYEAAHINLVQDAIKAIEAELGANPSGNLATLKDRLSGVIDENGSLIPYFPGNVITVGPDHCHFTSIQAAIDSITDASSDKIYSVLIYPSTYNENITMKSYVNLIGFSRASVIIAGKVHTAPNVTISYLTIQKDLQNDYLVDLSNSYGVTFDHVSIYNNSNNGGGVKQTTPSTGNSFYHSSIIIDNDEENPYYPIYTTGQPVSLYYSKVQTGSLSCILADSGAYGYCDIFHTQFYGGHNAIELTNGGRLMPLILFSYFDQDYQVFVADQQRYFRVANSVFNCDSNSIYTNIINTAITPNNGNIMEE